MSPVQRTVFVNSSNDTHLDIVFSGHGNNYKTLSELKASVSPHIKGSLQEAPRIKPGK